MVKTSEELRKEFLGDLLFIHKKSKPVLLSDLDEQTIKYITNCQVQDQTQMGEFSKKRATLYFEYTKELYNYTTRYITYLKSQKAKVDEFSIAVKGYYQRIKDLDEEIEEGDPKTALIHGKILFENFTKVVEEIKIREEELLEHGKNDFYIKTFAPIASILTVAFIGFATIYKEQLMPNIFWTIILYAITIYGAFKLTEHFFFKEFEEESSEQEEEDEEE